MASASKSTANRDRGAAAKYLTFRLAEEEYGIGVIRVREIMGVQHITHVPQTPPHVRGVINLRGKVIPVVDMREKLGFPPKEYDKRTCIVVVSAVVEGQDVMTGVVVDSVSEVASIGAEEIEAPPSFGAGVEVRYLHGLARTGDRVKMLLNIDQILDAEDALLALPDPDAVHPLPTPSVDLAPVATI